MNVLWSEHILGRVRIARPAVDRAWQVEVRGLEWTPVDDVAEPDILCEVVTALARQVLTLERATELRREESSR
jgi:hypothetical protein